MSSQGSAAAKEDIIRWILAFDGTTAPSWREYVETTIWPLIEQFCRVNGAEPVTTAVTAAENTENQIALQAGSAETGGEKAAPFTLEITKEEEGWYCWVTWPQGASFAIGEPCETRHGAEEHMGIIRKMLATFHRSPQNQAVSSGVEGAHEGTTADKSELLPTQLPKEK